MSPDRVRIHFTEELAQLEQQALGALDLVIQILDRTLEALEHQDIELAGIVVLDDDRIEGRYLEVHQGILSLLARQAPVATDLRLVAALLHVIKHVERMGNQCVNIAKLLPLTGWEAPVQQEILTLLLRMGQRARSEVAQAKQAFLLRDLGLAQDLVRQDEEVNRLNKEVFAQAIRMGADEDVREWASAMVLVARAIERIGDNAVDVAEQAVFVVTGRVHELHLTGRDRGSAE